MGIAIITGASSGIGAEFARQINADKKWNITEFWLIARRKERLLGLAEELGTKCKIIEADLACEEGINAVTAELSLEKPEVDILINCAGFGNFGTYEEITPAEVTAMIDVNIKALVLITHATIPYIKRGGRIIEMGSGSCFTPLPAFNVYAASKSFVLHYTKALNFEIKAKGIRATCFCPGWVKTEFIGKATETPRTEMKKFWPLLDCRRVVRGCLRASKRGRRMYVTGLYTKFQHMLFKYMPSCVLSRVWCGMLNRKLW